MQKQKLYEIVINYLQSEFEIPSEELHREANLFEDLGLDSIDALDLVAKMEAELKISIIEEELKEIRTIQDVVNYILLHLPKDSTV